MCYGKTSPMVMSQPTTDIQLMGFSPFPLAGAKVIMEDLRLSP